MRDEELFSAAVPLVRSGGGIAVVTNGTPLWLQDTDWSRTLRGFLERRLGVKATYACGTDEDSQREYQRALAAAGFEVVSAAVEYVAELDMDRVVGSVLSAMTTGQLPAADQRPVFAEQLRQALGGRDQFSEQVQVAIVAGRVP